MTVGAEPAASAAHVAARTLRDFRPNGDVRLLLGRIELSDEQHGSAAPRQPGEDSTVCVNEWLIAVARRFDVKVVVGGPSCQDFCAVHADKDDGAGSRNDGVEAFAEVSIETGALFIVMDYEPGGDLQTLLENVGFLRNCAWHFVGDAVRTCVRREFFWV